MIQRKKELIKRALKLTMPIFAGYTVLGMGYGMILTSKGISPFWAFFQSLFIYGGTMQYVGVELIAASAPLFTIAMTSVLINARHLFYGISMIDKFKGAGLLTGYMSFALTDESYSLLVAESGQMEDKDRISYFFYICLLDHIYWIFGGCLGAFLGSVLNFNSKGMDFVLTALFVTIFVDQWEKNPHHLSALLGLGLSLLALIVFGPDHFLIPAMILILIGLFAIRGREEGKYLADPDPLEGGSESVDYCNADPFVKETNEQGGE